VPSHLSGDSNQSDEASTATPISSLGGSAVSSDKIAAWTGETVCSCEKNLSSVLCGCLCQNFPPVIHSNRGASQKNAVELGGETDTRRYIAKSEAARSKLLFPPQLLCDTISDDRSQCSATW